MFFAKPLWVVIAILFAPLTSFALQQPSSDDPFADPTQGAPATPPPAPVAAPNGLPAQPPALLDEAFGTGSLLAREEELRQAAAQAMNQNTRAQLSEASKLMKTDPTGVKNSLKARLEEIDAAVDLDPAIRADLRAKLQSAIRTAAVEEGRYLDRIQRSEVLNAQADASQRLLAEVSRTDESVKQLVEQFNYLIAQRKYLEASKDIAPEVGRLVPDTPIENTIRESSSLLANYSLLREVYERREQGLVDAFRGVETSAVPIDEPTIIYPPAEVWQALSARRKERYGAINLAGGAGGSKAEQKITAALKQITKDIEYQGTPLRQVMQELQDSYNIPIRLNTVEWVLSVSIQKHRLRSACHQTLACEALCVRFWLQSKTPMQV